MHDVAVVGSGPAGSTLARLLAEAGADVVLLERDRLPRYKPCGGGLTQRSVRLLPEEARALVRLWSPAADLVYRHYHLRMRTAAPVVGLVMRDELDHCLARLAVRAGARLRDGAPVTAARAVDGAVELIAGGEPVRARRLACADGATGPFSGALGAAVGLPRCAPRIGAVEVELEDPDGAWGGRLRADFDVIAGGYAWVFPKAGILSVGVASWRSGLGGGALRRALDGYIERLGLAGRRVLRRHGHAIPVGGRLAAAHLAGPLAVRLGDAAGLADPLFGEGIAHALNSAHLAAQPILRGDLEAYAAAVERDVLTRFRVAAVLGRLLYGAPGPFFLAARLWPALGDRVYSRAVRAEWAATPPARGGNSRCAS